MSVTVKELLKSDNVCQSYAEMKKGPVFLLFTLDKHSLSAAMLVTFFCTDATLHEMVARIVMKLSK